MAQMKQLMAFMILVIGAFSVGITLVALLSIPLYSAYIHLLNLAPSVGLTVEQLEEAYRAVIQYLYHPLTKDISIPYFSSSQQGVHHFRDVKLLIQINTILSLISMVMIPRLLKFLKKSRKNMVIEHGFTLAYLTPLMLLFFIFIGFDRLFILFHELLFTNDYWLFDPHLDPIINVLPQSFFMLLFVSVILIYEVLIWLISGLYQRMKK